MQRPYSVLPHYNRMLGYISQAGLISGTSSFRVTPDFDATSIAIFLTASTSSRVAPPFIAFLRCQAICRGVPIAILAVAITNEVS